MKKIVLAALAAGVLSAGSVAAQTTVTLPDTAQTTTLTAEVSEQAQVTVPAGVTFAVNDVGASTAASAAAVTIDNIVLATATKQLKISVQAAAADFTPPVALATTWAATDVTWNAATWTNASGAAGTLSSSVYTEVATCAADAASCSTTGLVFTLGAKPTVQRSGNHTLSITWKFESIGT
ncbi:MAG TPA: hypothetical protein VHQ65_09765 [Thermoanaerobaculia bacterium]|nr:hypothetical protein [Thermoanaerobaculia bacterium]